MSKTNFKYWDNKLKFKCIVHEELKIVVIMSSLNTKEEGNRIITLTLNREIWDKIFTILST